VGWHTANPPSIPAPHTTIFWPKIGCLVGFVGALFAEAPPLSALVLVMGDYAESAELPLTMALGLLASAACDGATSAWCAQSRSESIASGARGSVGWSMLIHGLMCNKSVTPVARGGAPPPHKHPLLQNLAPCCLCGVPCVPPSFVHLLSMPSNVHG